MRLRQKLCSGLRRGVTTYAPPNPLAGEQELAVTTPRYLLASIFAFSEHRDLFECVHFSCRQKFRFPFPQKYLH